MPGDLDETYVRARRVLLDALQALAEHRSAIILVGAQAIYLHTGEGEIAVAPYTSDGDLAIDPGTLGSSPLLEHVLSQAGFVQRDTSGVVGTWIGQDDVPIDLMVPDRLAGPGTRAARLGPHGNRVARRARGLEAAVIDYQEMLVAALDPSDSRQLSANVAGPAALLVAKLHKLADRQHSPRRQDDKDAYDILRLLEAVPTALIANRLGILLEDERSMAVTQEALGYLTDLFGDVDAPGCQMAARYVELLADPETVAASSTALSQDLLAAIGRA